MGLFEPLRKQNEDNEGVEQEQEELCVLLTPSLVRDDSGDGGYRPKE